MAKHLIHYVNLQLQFICALNMTLSFLASLRQQATRGRAVIVLKVLRVRSYNIRKNSKEHYSKSGRRRAEKGLRTTEKRGTDRQEERPHLMCSPSLICEQSSSVAQRLAFVQRSVVVVTTTAVVTATGVGASTSVRTATLIRAIRGIRVRTTTILALILGVLGILHGAGICAGYALHDFTIAVVTRNLDGRVGKLLLQ